MAFSCGFFNSYEHDRRYNAEQMSAIFDGVINDGVFESIGNKLFTVPGSGRNVVVQSGKAWFDHTWNVNDGSLTLAIDAADPTQQRIDAVVLETNHNNDTRQNKIYVIKGAVGGSKPSMSTSDPNIKRHPLAYVTVKANATSFLANDIEIMVGKTETPFVTSVVQQTNIDSLWNGWKADFEGKLVAWKAEFDAWFEDIQSVVSGDVITGLQNQITQLKASIQEVQTGEIKVYTGTAAPSSLTGKNFDFYVKTR